MRKEQSYLLRLWNDGQSPETWRARLEEVRSRKVMTFASLEALSAYLKELPTGTTNEKSPTST